MTARNKLQVSVVDARKLPDNLRGELEDTQLLFEAVNTSIVGHLYGNPANRFEDKREQFDYSLGKDTARLNLLDSDAFVLVNGLDQISSTGRQALNVTAMLAAAALGVVLIPQPGITAMNVALVDARSGDLLWYVATRSEGGYDLRNPERAAAFVKHVLTGFPIP